jgi:hypothetical protein
MEYNTSTVSVNSEYLSSLLRKALGEQTVELREWESQRLKGGLEIASAIHRLEGSAVIDGDHRNWSLILKSIQPETEFNDQQSYRYWRREIQACQSGMLEGLPGQIRAPRCYGIQENPDGSVWLWLEDVEDEIGEYWPLEHYGIVAQHLGQFNGAYLVGEPIPSWPWLSSGWLRGYVEQSAPAMVELRDMMDHPLVQRWFPGDSSDRLFRTWDERGRILDVLDHLPQTLCHLDAFRRNLFAQKDEVGDYQTLAVDWAFTGKGAVGEELVSLILSSIFLSEVDLTQTQKLEDIVFEGYLEGLREAGWHTDPRVVRLGYTAASIRYRFADFWRGLEIIRDESLHSGIEQVMEQPIGEFFDMAGELGNLADERVSEALELMDILG